MTQERRDILIFIIAFLGLLVTILRFATEPTFETLAIVLSSAGTILALYASKKKVEKAEKRYITKPKRLFEVSVALWGPTGTGKTWLVHAFGRTLLIEYSREIEGLVYELKPVTQQNYSALEGIPTKRAEVFEFNFERSRTSDNYAQSISSFKHKIRVFDNRGVTTVSPFDDDLIVDMSGEQEESYKTALLNIIHSDVVLIILDPDCILNPIVNYTDGLKSNWDLNRKNSPDYRKTTYPKMVKDLLSYLEAEKSNRKRYYAVCVTKADLIEGGVYLSPDELIKLYFGEDMTEALRIPDPRRIKTFTTSSVGFFSLKGKEIANITANGDHLLAPNNWRPYGVEHPFFWAFEELEKQSLRDLFQKQWWKRLNCERLLKKYIPYPKPEYKL